MEVTSVKNQAAAELARLRWSRISPEKRSELMRQVRAATPVKRKKKKKLQ